MALPGDPGARTTGSCACASAAAAKNRDRPHFLPALRSRSLNGGSAKSREQRVALLPRGDDIFHLDMAEAADLLRQRSDLHGSRVVLRRQPLQELLHRVLVLADQRALGAALFGVAENVERSAAETFEIFQQLEDLQHPGPEADFPQLAARRILARDERRRAVIDHAVVALAHGV